MKIGILFGCATLSLAVVAGCGGDKKATNTPPNGSAAPTAAPPPTNNPPPPATGANTAYPPPPATGANTAYPPPPATGTAQPPPPATGTAQPPPPPSNQAQQIDPNVAMVAQTALATFANGQLQPGMVREGNTLAGNFTPGQMLPMAFTIVPGKCYSIVAAGVGPGMDLEITAQASGPIAIPGFNPQFGQAKGKPSPTGSSAVLGEKANCIKLALSPVPIQATYIVRVTKGSGMVAAQLFSK
jgi:hypothetical protein